MTTVRLTYRRWSDACARRRAGRKASAGGWSDAWSEVFDDQVLLCTCADGAPCT